MVDDALSIASSRQSIQQGICQENQTIDGLFLEPAGVETIKSIHMFEGEDGKVRTVIGMRGDACAKMSAPNFKKKNASARRAKVFLDIETPAVVE